MRIFICSNRRYLGKVGGGGGVNYRLADINLKKYKNKNVINIFYDKDVSVESVIDSEVTSVSTSRIRLGLFHEIYKLPYMIPLIFFRRLFKAKKNLKKSNKKYHFTSKDFYYFHDMDSAIAFKKLYNFQNTALIYHHQGSIYFEWSSDTGKKSKLLKKWLNHYMIKAFKSVEILGFPSNGAKESLINTEPLMKDILQGKRIEIFYNGIDTECSGQIVEMSNIFKNRIYNSKSYVFISVSNLNEAKGVDRIPQFLFDFKNKGYDFIWVLVGNGVKEAEITQYIHNYNLDENVIWIKDHLEHAKIIKLLEMSDFYIMLHRYSIFDFATVEAMSSGCIPILSNVGGNKEVVIGENGCLINDVSNSSELVLYLKKIDMPKIKDKNKQIQSMLFSENAFFKRYIDFALSFDK